ncbi:MAG: hypothetical protein JWN12_63 [Candidatus Saccharibacteria bacterium]|nr:hypothetical protein [Candidatus Saccharibacteria bacterium]
MVIDFLNSGFFIALLGTTGAVTAYVLYRRRIGNQKKDAANIVSLELQKAKRQIGVASKQIRDANGDETKMLAEDTFLMPNESWSKYKYLFVRDFDRDQWDAISTFYDKTKLFDMAVVENNQAFAKNADQIRISMSEAIKKILEDHIIQNPTSKVGSALEKTAIANAKKAHDLIINSNNLYDYSPRKPVVDAQALLAVTKEQSIDSVITILKKIAKIKN